MKTEHEIKAEIEKLKAKREKYCKVIHAQDIDGFNDDANLKHKRNTILEYNDVIAKIKSLEKELQDAKFYTNLYNPNWDKNISLFGRGSDENF